jgi:hypothetical protein
VPLDADGKPILPFQVGILTLLQLGTIVHDREMFHTDRYLYPVGYAASREYYSIKDPEKIVKYTSSIRDGGDAPLFVVVAEDNLDEPIIANSATGAWSHIVKGTS